MNLFISVDLKKREKIWLDQDLIPQSVDQKLILLTITPLVTCLKYSKSIIYVTYIVMRQNVARVKLELTDFSNHNIKIPSKVQTF